MKNILFNTYGETRDVSGLHRDFFKKYIIENPETLVTITLPENIRIEQISDKIYGTPDYYWVIHLCNNYENIFFDYPLTNVELQEYAKSMCINILKKNEIFESDNNYTSEYNDIYGKVSLILQEKNDKKRTIKIIKTDVIQNILDKLTN